MFVFGNNMIWFFACKHSIDANYVYLLLFLRTHKVNNTANGNDSHTWNHMHLVFSFCLNFVWTRERYMEKELGKLTCEITHAFVPRSHHRTQFKKQLCEAEVKLKYLGGDERRAAGDSIHTSTSKPVPSERSTRTVLSMKYFYIISNWEMFHSGHVKIRLDAIRLKYLTFERLKCTQNEFQFWKTKTSMSLTPLNGGQDDVERLFNTNRSRRTRSIYQIAQDRGRIPTYNSFTKNVPAFSFELIISSDNLGNSMLEENSFSGIL